MKSQITKLAFLLSLFLVGIISTTNINAWTVTSFPPSNFWVVDDTRVPTYWNPGMVVGYKVDTLKDSNKTITGYQYQMTDTAFYMESGIWNNKHKIDLTKNFTLDLKLYFGRGLTRYNYHLQPGDRNHRISDGMCFVLHTKDSTITKRALGYSTLGYTTDYPEDPDFFPLIVSTFAVEWDTQFSYVFDGSIDDIEGFPMIQDTNYNYWYTITRCHTSYLKNANMAAIKRQDGSPAAAQMQNDWGGVAYNDWLDARIEWKRNYDTNGTPYYDLLTYIQEGPNTDKGPLLLRNSMRFNSISDVIDGLELDSNCQALVTWGITCASGNVSNKHKVEFVRLTNYDTDSLNDELPFVISVAHNQQNGQAVTQVFDTLYTSTAGCNNSYTLPPASDTITLEHICFSKKDSARLYVKGLKDTTGMHWRANTIPIPIKSDSIGAYIDLNNPILLGNYDNIYDNYYLYLTLVYPNWSRQIEFKLKMDNTDYILTELAQSLDISVDTANHSVILELDSTSTSQAIKLPETLAEWCFYLPVKLGEKEDTNFVSLPNIDSNNVLSFELKPEICSVNIPINVKCGCEEELTLVVKNKDCKRVVDCEGLSISDGILVAVDAGTADSIFSIPADELHKWSYNAVAFSSNNKVKEIMIYDPVTSDIITHTMTKDDGTIIFPFKCPLSIVPVSIPSIRANPYMVENGHLVPNMNILAISQLVDSAKKARAISLQAKICFVFENEAICCDTVTLNHQCPSLILAVVGQMPVKGKLILNYELVPEILDWQLPLKISVYDQFSNYRMNIKNSVPNGMKETIEADVSNLNAGMYYMLFEIGDYIDVINFIKE